MLYFKKIFTLLFLFSFFLFQGCSIQDEEASFYKEINSETDYNILIEKMSNFDLVLLGESTHGTEEYYEIRRILSQKLIENYNFNFIAVEGDWSLIYELDLYIKGKSEFDSAYDVLKTFDRWPEWMLANEQIRILAEWLREHNLNLDDKVSIYGFDLYNAEESIRIVEKYTDFEYNCLFNFKNDLSLYARYIHFNNQPCNFETENIYYQIKNNLSVIEKLDNHNYFNIKQNAFVVMNAEKHYRGMAVENINSWNVRALHMNSTIGNLINLDKNKKGIIWAHNTHIGDSRATEMFDSNLVNIGYLLRESDISTFSLGFGTYKGEVLAGSSWGSAVQKMVIPEANLNSYEYILNDMGFENVIIFLNDSNLPEIFKDINNNRAIGVVYNPLIEYPGNYVLTDIVNRYDSFIFIRETSALNLFD